MKQNITFPWWDGSHCLPWDTNVETGEQVQEQIRMQEADCLTLPCPPCLLSAWSPQSTFMYFTSWCVTKINTKQTGMQMVLKEFTGGGNSWTWGWLNTFLHQSASKISFGIGICLAASDGVPNAPLAGESYGTQAQLGPGAPCNCYIQMTCSKRKQSTQTQGTGWYQRSGLGILKSVSFRPPTQPLSTRPFFNRLCTSV